MIPVVLGLDPSKTKLGWGCVRDDDGSPIRADYEPLDGSPERSHRAIVAIARWLAVRDLEPVFALVEYPFGGKGSAGIFDSGVAVGMVELSVRLCWPSMPCDRIGAIHWRPKVGVPKAPADYPAGSTARRNWLKEADVARARELGFDIPIVGVRKRRPSDDAADGALIARTAWLRLEAGDAPRRIPSPERTAA